MIKWGDLMKVRYLAIVVAIALLLVLVGCGKKAAPAPAAPAPAPAAPAPAPEAPAETTTEDTTETTAPTGSAEEEGVVVDEGEDITEMAEEEKEAQGLAVDVQTGEGAFASATCALRDVDGKEKRVLTVTLMNVEEDDWEIYGKENPKGKVRIGNRGIIDITPGCDPLTVAPGETAACNGLDMGVVAGENRVTVNTPSGQFARVVMCP